MTHQARYEEGRKTKEPPDFKVCLAHTCPEVHYANIGGTCIAHVRVSGELAISVAHGSTPRLVTSEQD